MIKRVRLDRLLWPTPVSAWMNPLVVMSLMYTLRGTTEEADPILVIREGKYFRIKDGRHRAVAAMMAGRRRVLAVIE